MLKDWLMCILLWREKRVDPSEVKDVAEGAQLRLSLLSFEHPEGDAPSDQIYCGRLFARKVELGKQETHEHPIALLFDGSDEDLTLKIIDLIVEMGYQRGYTLTIVLDTLREPIPEPFLNAFDN